MVTFTIIGTCHQVILTSVNLFNMTSFKREVDNIDSGKVVYDKKHRR